MMLNRRPGKGDYEYVYIHTQKCFFSTPTPCKPLEGNKQIDGSFYSGHYSKGEFVKQSDDIDSRAHMRVIYAYAGAPGSI